MTAVRRDGSHQSPFFEWIRQVPALDSRAYQISITDGDAWIHRFSRRNELSGTDRLVEHLQLVEVKAFSADLPFAQRDTLNVIDLLIRKATVTGHRRRPIVIPDYRFGHGGCRRSVRWLGVHVLQLSADRPDNSVRIVWDGKHDINEQTLIELLRFDRDPDHPGRLLDTRRHHRRPALERHPQLQLAARREPTA